MRKEKRKKLSGTRRTGQVHTQRAHTHVNTHTHNSARCQGKGRTSPHNGTGLDAVPAPSNMRVEDDGNRDN